MRRILAYLTASAIATLAVMTMVSVNAGGAATTPATHGPIASTSHTLNFGYFSITTLFNEVDGVAPQPPTTFTGGISASVTNDQLTLSWGPTDQYFVSVPTAALGQGVPPLIHVQGEPTCGSGTASGSGGFLSNLVMSGTTVVSAAIQFNCSIEGPESAPSDVTIVAGAVAFNLPAEPGSGYYAFTGNGTLVGYGNNDYLTYLGNDLPSGGLNAPVVGMSTANGDSGYWLAAADGGVFNYGTSEFHGSAGNLRLRQPVVGISGEADGGGYWLVASDGGIFAYGDAPFYGSTGNLTLNKPVVAMASTADGKGYWMVASDGGVFAFGDAKFYGSMGGQPLNQPVVGMASTPDGNGYWLVAADGGVFSFGDAGFFGSIGGAAATTSVVGMASTNDGKGYWIASGPNPMTALGSDVAPFGDAPKLGSLPLGAVGLAR